MNNDLISRKALKEANIKLNVTNVIMMIVLLKPTSALIAVQE